MTPRLAALAILDAAALAIGAGGWGMALHAVLTVAALLLWLRAGEALRLGAAVLAMVGPAGLLIARLLARRADMPRPADPTVMAQATPAPRGQNGAALAVARMLDGRVRHADADTLGSLVTVLRHGDVAARRRALETAVRSFQPSLSPLIAMALTDGDQTIRALAAAASARVAQNLALARAATPAAGGEAAHAALLADHARSDVLLSDSQRLHLREEALALMPEQDPAAAALHMEAAWARGDYAALDRLAERASDAEGGWWRAEAAA